jgi:arylsulfatase A-like enzyme
MSTPINRRDFLRLAGLLPLSVAAPRWARTLSGAGGQKNVIIVVFDAFSAYNISLYGYARETTPNLARLAKRAIVYHNHYAGSNFTTSGTASLLTATLPWTHRAIKGNGEVAQDFVTRTVFDAFEDYYRIAYTHNPWAFTLLSQFKDQIDDLVAKQKLFLRSYDSFIDDLFRTDEDIASISWARNVKAQDGYAYSLFLSHLEDMLLKSQYSRLQQEYPLGLPALANGNLFLLEQAMAWIASTLTSTAQPFLGYFHFLPPHAPYRPPVEYIQHFVHDEYRSVNKPVDVFASNTVDQPAPLARTEYDQFILYADREFGRFYDDLVKSGLLDSTWLILTSDHGEMFERGIVGHGSDALYEPLMRIPLMIFEPGRQQGMDIHSLTSAVDVLPTLAHLTGHGMPAWSEGTLLPPYASGEPDPKRSVYAARATRNNPAAPLTVASTMLVKDRYKLLYYFGYSALHVPDTVKLYDLKADPEEMKDLLSVEKDIGAALLNELKAKLAEVNRPYE